MLIHSRALVHCYDTFLRRWKAPPYPTRSDSIVAISPPLDWDLWACPELCVWGLAHAVKTAHLLNRSVHRIASWFLSATHALTHRSAFSKLQVAR